MITIEVAYATPKRQLILSVDVSAGTTMIEAVRASGILREFPEIDMASVKMGVWGKTEKDPATRIMQTGERIEVYRPLLIDPKEARKNRASKATTP
ncbi:RnfH family protein [Litorivicinus lipolyticus]|uniref:RnfH family protein n=1 Tax=Litorivicinus lipolyticus TaxID=418701 RepID=UPI003B597C4C